MMERDIEACGIFAWSYGLVEKVLDSYGNEKILLYVDSDFRVRIKNRMYIYN